MAGRTARMHAYTPIFHFPGETGNSVRAGSVVVPWGMCGLGLSPPVWLLPWPAFGRRVARFSELSTPRA